MDLEKFFDKVNHDILMSKLEKKIHDKRLLSLIRKYLKSGILINGVSVISEEGTPQGGPLSPLLANIMLDELDKELEKRGHKFCRYADDNNVYVKSKRAGIRVMESMKNLIENKLKLKVNKNKSAVDFVSKRKFLGFSFHFSKSGAEIRIHEKSIKMFKEKIKFYTNRNRGISMEYRLLNYFNRNLEKDGYVKKIGGLNGKDRYWSFIDWTPEWDATTGVPSATLEGAITMESLLYIIGLQHAAKISEYLGLQDQTNRYLTRAKEVQRSVRKNCIGKDGMLQDGPGIEQYSQHVQVFAVLTDTVEEEKGKENLRKTIINKDEYVQCSVAMAFYLFRALEKTGLYELTEEYWKIWIRMLEKGATTCVENEVGERSECHAWGSLILYELPSIVLGVQPAKAGYEAVRIRPEAGYLKSAEGSVITPKGTIKVRWRRENEMKLEYEVPENLEVSL